jgi:hypothetical protein
MSALAVNIIIVHPWEDVVFPGAKAQITIKLNISCAKVWENHQFPYINAVVYVFICSIEYRQT